MLPLDTLGTMLPLDTLGTMLPLDTLGTLLPLDHSLEEKAGNLKQGFEPMTIPLSAFRMSG